MSQGLRLKEAAREAMRKAEVEAETVAVSAITGWEACLLEKLRRTGKIVGGDGQTWFYTMVQLLRLDILPVDERIAIGSRRLPGDFHQDPADRFIVATARLYDVPMITTDRKILSYAAQGHVRAIAC